MRGPRRAASHCCSSVLHDDRVEKKKGRLTLMNLELDFRRHVYGGDVGQRIELGQQHPFEDIHHRRTTTCVFVLFCFEKEIFIPILSLPLFFF